MTLPQVIAGYEVLGIATILALRFAIVRAEDGTSWVPDDAESFLIGGLILLGWPLVWFFWILVSLFGGKDPR